eukprot:c14531_g1_i1 orf=2-238(-)
MLWCASIVILHVNPSFNSSRKPRCARDDFDFTCDRCAYIYRCCQRKSYEALTRSFIHFPLWEEGSFPHVFFVVFNTMSF